MIKYPAYMFNHPDDVRQILVTDASKFNKAPVYKDLLSYFLGNGLLTSEGDFWRRQRKLAQPAFHYKRIQAYAKVMVEYTTRLLKEWKPEEIRDINSDMARLTLSIVSKTLFNADIEQDASQIGKALTDCQTLVQEIQSRKRPAAVPQAEAPVETVGAAPAAAARPVEVRGNSREEIYARLAEAADQLMKMEPHSPVAYMIQRAVKLGHLSLPELIKVLVRDRK